MTIAYRVALIATRTFVQGYGRLTVAGAEQIPREGPVLLLANHDSPLDAFIISVAARRRQIRFLTKQSLWRYRPLGLVLDKLHQIPIERGMRDTKGLDAAIAALRARHCVCVFPEGTISHGQRLRIRRGAARLLASVPEAEVVGCALIGGPELKRLRFGASVRIVFFTAARSGIVDSDKSAVDLIEETMQMIRSIAPPSC